MKRLVLFVTIFGAGLLVLVLVLGPDRLWRRTEAPSIRPQDLPPAPTAVALSQQQQRISVGFRGAGTIPRWTEVAQPDGSKLRVKAAQLKYTDNEPFVGGIHLIGPLLELFPGKQAEERPRLRIKAAGAEVATRRDLRSLSEGFTADDLREIALAPDARLEMLDESGAPTMTVDTARFEVPESPEPAEDETKAPLFPRLVAPKPVHVYAANGGFDLNAAALEVRRLEGRLEFAGPLTLVASDFDLPGVGPAAAPPTAKRRPPLTVTCDGRALFTARTTGRDPRHDGGDADPLLDPARAVGPGTLVFERNVMARQTAEGRDGVPGGEAWLRTDLITLELDRDATGRLVITKLDAGGVNSDVAFGLLGGEGVAHHLSRGRDDEPIVLTGPLHVDGLNFGRDGATRSLSIAAGERLVAREVAATDAVAAHWHAELFGNASVKAPGELAADAGQITTDLFEAAGGSYELGGLDLDGRAHVELPGQGDARADHIRLRDDGKGGRTAHLDGNSEVTTPRGTLVAPRLDVDVPATKSAPLHVVAPLLTRALMELPPGLSLFDATAASKDGRAPRVEPKDGGPAATRRRLRLEPLAPTHFEILGEALHLRGRTTIHVLQLGPKDEELETQRVTADSLDVTPTEGGPPELVADGTVDVFDDEAGHRLELHAEHVRTRTAPDGRRHLVVDGTPALGALTVTAADLDPADAAAVAALAAGPARIELESIHLDVDLLSRAIVADDVERRVIARIPETLAAPLLAPGFGLPGSGDVPLPAAAELAAMKPVEFRAEHVDVTPQPLAPGAAAAAASPLARAQVNARGRLHIDRESDGTKVDAARAQLDFARSFARIDGTPAAAGTAALPVTITRPRVYAPDRVDSVVTDWIEAKSVARRGDDAPATRLELAPKSRFVFFPEEAPKDGKPPRMMRVELVAADAPEFLDRRLSFTGGVETFITAAQKDDPDRFQTAHFRSERVELTLSGSPGDRDLAPLRLKAQERVRLDYGPEGAKAQVLTGTTLSYDFATGRLLLREGVERCRLLAFDDEGAWHATAEFQSMTADLQNANPLGKEIFPVSFKDFRFLAEGARGR